MKNFVFLKYVLFILILALLSCQFDFMGESLVDNVKLDLKVKEVSTEWENLLNDLQSSGLAENIFNLIKSRIEKIREILKNVSLRIKDKEKIVEDLQKELEKLKNKDVEEIKGEYEEKLKDILGDLDKIIKDFDEYSDEYLNAKKRERDNLYSYKDYKKFSRELKELYDWRISLVSDDVDEVDIKNKKDFFKDHLDIFSLKDIYIYKDKYMYSYHKEVKRNLEILEDFHNGGNISKKVIPIKFRDVYYSIYSIMIYKNAVGIAGIKKMDPDFEILFIKEALAKVTRLFIYYYPYLYDYVAYLFEDSDKHFK